MKDELADRMMSVDKTSTGLVLSGYETSLAVPEEECYGGNMELYKHLLLTGDCKGSPATFDLGYTV